MKIHTVYSAPLNSLSSVLLILVFVDAAETDVRH